MLKVAVPPVQAVVAAGCVVTATSVQLEQLIGAKSATWSFTLLEDPCEALSPIPLLRKASLMAHTCAPLYNTWSAWRMASLPLMNPGLQGCNFIPSVTSFSAITLPPFAVPLYKFGLMVPTWLMIFQVISHSVAHQISPRL